MFMVNLDFILKAFMFAPTKGLSHYGNFTLEKVGKNHAIYQFGLLDKDGDSGIGHFKVNRRGKMSFFGEKGIDDSKLSKDDPLLFTSNAGDDLSWGSLVKGVSSVSDIIDQVGHYGSIAAKGLDTADSIIDSLSDFGKSTGLFRRSDDLSFGGILSGISQGISLIPSLINTAETIAPFILG